MKTRNFGDLIGATCSGLLMLGSLLVLGRAFHRIAWPWWAVLLPWAVVLAVFVVTLLFVLAKAAVEEGRSARENRRERERRSFHYEP